MSSKDVAPKKVLEMMKEATGASEEDICVMLQLCNGDANEATEKLLENPFAKVESKKEKRLKADEQRRKDAEQQRRIGVDGRRVGPISRGRGRGEGARTGGRGFGRGLGRGVTGGFSSSNGTNASAADENSWSDATPAIAPITPSEAWGDAPAASPGYAEHPVATPAADERWGTSATSAVKTSAEGWGSSTAPAAPSATLPLGSSSSGSSSATKEGVSFASLLRSKTEAAAAASAGGGASTAVAGMESSSSLSGVEVSPPSRQPLHQPSKTTGTAAAAGGVGSSPAEVAHAPAAPPALNMPAALAAPGPADVPQSESMDARGLHISDLSGTSVDMASAAAAGAAEVPVVPIPVEAAAVPAGASTPSTLYRPADTSACAAKPLYGPAADVASSDMDSLQLTFGNFTLNSPGMGDFSSGFGSGFSSDAASTPAPSAASDVFGSKPASAAVPSAAPVVASAMVSSAADGAYKAPGYNAYGGASTGADKPAPASSRASAGYAGLQVYSSLEGFSSGTVDATAATPAAGSYGDAFGSGYGQDGLKGAAASYAGVSANTASSASPSNSYQPNNYSTAVPAAKYAGQATASGYGAAAGPSEAATATSSSAPAVATTPSSLPQIPYGSQAGLPPGMHAAYNMYTQYPNQMYNMYANPYGYNPYNPYAAPPGQAGFPPQQSTSSYGASAASSYGNAASIPRYNPYTTAAGSSSAATATAGATGVYEDAAVAGVAGSYSTYGSYGTVGGKEKDAGNLYGAYTQKQGASGHQGYDYSQYYQGYGQTYYNQYRP